MNDGVIDEAGTYAELRQAGRAFDQLIQSTMQAAESSSEPHSPATTALPSAATKSLLEAEKPVQKPTSAAEKATKVEDGAIGGAKATDTEKQAGKKLMSEEGREKGTVSLGTYLTYMRAGGGLFFWGFTFFMFILASAGKGFSDYWLSFWLGHGDGKHHADGSRGSINVCLCFCLCDSFLKPNHSLLPVRTTRT
jgi:hypothetical protein